MSPALAGKFSSTAPRGVLVPYFYLLFLLWIKILHSTYYTFLLTLTSRNQDRRGNEGKRIKPHFCCAGSLPYPLSPLLPPTSQQQLLSIKSNTKGVSWSDGGWEKWAGAGTWDIHRWVRSFHEYTARVSFPNTEMKLTVTLRVDQGTDQKSSYSVINSVSKLNFPSNILEYQ